MEVPSDLVDADTGLDLGKEAASAVAPFVSEELGRYVPVVGAGLSFFQALASRNDSAITEAMTREAFDAVLGLEKKLERLEEELRKKGKAPEPLDATGFGNVLRDFATEWSKRADREERLRLTLATANVFNPEKGRFSTRQLRLSQLRAMSAIQLEALALIGRSRLVFGKNQSGPSYARGSRSADPDKMAASLGRSETVETVSVTLLPSSDWQALVETYEELQAAGVLARNHLKKYQYILSAKGLELYSMLEDFDGSPESE